MPKSKAKGRPVKKVASASKMGKKSKPTKAGIKKAAGEKKRKFRPGTVALREIRRY